MNYFCAMNYLLNSIGEIVAEARKKEGFKTQAELAFKLKATPIYLCNIENNKFIPSVNMGIKIAKTLNLDLKQFIFLILRSKHSTIGHIFL